MKIGLSLSMCIKDIIEGKVDPRDVSVIITNCLMRNDEEHKMIVDAYCPTWWSSNPEMARNLLTAFHSQGRIINPRETDPNYAHHHSGASWIDVRSRSRAANFMACTPCMVTAQETMAETKA